MINIPITHTLKNTKKIVFCFRSNIAVRDVEGMVKVRVVKMTLVVIVVVVEVVVGVGVVMGVVKI